jgi:hypothetical protein
MSSGLEFVVPQTERRGDWGAQICRSALVEAKPETGYLAGAESWRTNGLNIGRTPLLPLRGDSRSPIMASCAALLGGSDGNGSVEVLRVAGA